MIDRHYTMTVLRKAGQPRLQQNPLLPAGKGEKKEEKNDAAFVSLHWWLYHEQHANTLALLTTTPN